MSLPTRRHFLHLTVSRIDPVTTTHRRRPESVNGHQTAPDELTIQPVLDRLYTERCLTSSRNLLFYLGYPSRWGKLSIFASG
jgi:hypothetical protein